jgi:hypothetical protein
MLKSLIVWLMLLAIPFQGFASATMLFCAPMHSMAPLQPVAGEPALHHQHGASAGTMADQQHANQEPSAGQHASGNCDSCATCCFGAAIAPSHATRLEVETQRFAANPFTGGSASSVDLALPERPPQASPT